MKDASHVGDKDARDGRGCRSRGRNGFRSEIDVLTCCRHTPLALCVSRMQRDFSFFAQGAQMRIAIPIVAQDLAEAAALRK